MTGQSSQGDQPTQVGSAVRGSPPVHQALFGYDSGHRLLVSSQPLNERANEALSRLTDGTGATDYVGFDGHLAGYPLPDGRYALTRTWAAPEVSRPGAVWTHVLLLERRHLGPGFAPSALAALLRRPGEQDHYDLALSHPSRSSQMAPPPDEPEGWQSALSFLFTEDDASTWLAASSADGVEPAVLSLWAWQWPSLRRRFAFSLGATGARREGRRLFDLVVVPLARQLSAQADLGPRPLTRTLAGDLIADDVAGRLPASFGDFCRYCGAESASRSSASALALAWHAATTSEPGGQATGRLLALAQSAADRYPEPTEMRRYKRLLLMPDRRLPARWTPDDALRALTETDLGTATAATDIDVDAVVSAASDPRILAASAAMSTQRKRAISAEAPNAAAAVPVAARCAIAERASPSWLAALAEGAPDTAAALLVRPTSHTRTVWAEAFWALPAQSRYAVARPDVSPDLAWLAARAQRTASGQSMLLEFCAANAEAIGPFAAELSALPPARRRAWTGVLTAPVVVDAAVTHAPHLLPPHAASLLCAVSPAAPAARSAGLRPWRELAAERMGAEAAAHALLLAPDSRPSKTEIILAARAYAVIWHALSGGDASIWPQVEDYASDLGGGASWDRSRRVAHRFARTVLGWDASGRGSPDAAGQAAAAARRDSPAAADQLVEELAKAGYRENRPKRDKRDKTLLEQIIDEWIAATKW